MRRRSKQQCVISPTNTNTKTKKVMPHDEFINRIRKSFYFGQNFYDDIEESLEISKPLAEYASELFSSSHRGHTLNRLSCVQAGDVQTATPAALIMALIYLDRLNSFSPDYVRRITPQELFIVSMMISTKFYAGHDEEIYISDWAEDGNITEDRLKELELEFLCAIEWNIYISNEHFFEKLTSIEKTLAQREGLKRGWLTYNELIQMLPSFTLAKFLLNNITIMAVSYAASVMTIAGAFFLASQIPCTSLHRPTARTNNAVSDLMASSDNDDDDDANPNKLISAKLNKTTTLVIGSTAGHNHSSTAGLDVEGELLKLEQHYRNEAEMELQAQKHNEITTESRLTLPQQMLLAKLNVHQKCAAGKAGQFNNRHGLWFVNKEKYSDFLLSIKDDINLNYAAYDNRQPSTILMKPEIILNELKSSSSLHHHSRHDNSSMAFVLWQYLADALQQASNMRMPLMWMKFM